MSRQNANPSGATTSGTPDRAEQARVAKEIDMSEAVDAGLDSEEFGLVCKCEGDTIDLLLDIRERCLT